MILVVDEAQVALVIIIAKTKKISREKNLGKKTLPGELTVNECGCGSVAAVAVVVLASLAADGVVVVEVEAMAKTSGEEMNHCSRDFC